MRVAMLFDHDQGVLESTVVEDGCPVEVAAERMGWLSWHPSIASHVAIYDCVEDGSVDIEA